MKAIEVLNWIIRESIEGEILNTIYVPKEGREQGLQNWKWWDAMFGARPRKCLEQGTYLYYYRSSTNEFFGYITDVTGKVRIPDAIIDLPTESDFDYIYLYKLED